MANFSLDLLGLRIFVSCIGIFGNVALMISIFYTKLNRIKSFELFLLALAASNLEEIVIVDTYDIVLLQNNLTVELWSCQLLKFLTAMGEICSILFTVLISVYRFQKLKDAHKRVNLPVYLDSMRSASLVSVCCVLVAVLLSFPIYVIHVERQADNTTTESGGCPLDFFECKPDHCPVVNRVYKYLFLLICNLLPLLIVTITGCLIMGVLLSQKSMVAPVPSVSNVSGSSQFIKKKSFRHHRSTIAVLSAMALFQIDWTLYLIFHLTIHKNDFSFWAEMEYFISVSYAAISPYVYGIGNNLFSFKKCSKN
ncbi:uncharacterized protein ora6 [Genypterus blacodes]|uniref:uncharacterized protein ora6 n=1 Tax=Genypterus blacodes TaxID=154954 RepID=UPI003F75FD5F